MATLAFLEIPVMGLQVRKPFISKGSPADIQTALNSITFDTGSVSGEVINLEVYIGSNDVARRYFKPFKWAYI